MNENSGMPHAQPQAAADIDMSFLQQFSCMGTTDHDELVHQLQKVIGGPMSTATAKFFLEMNNWNLQGAVGSYFDYHSSGLRLPSMRHISTQQGTTLPPQIQYAQSWHVQNNGEDPWPPGCYLRCTVPAVASQPSPANVAVEPLGAGDQSVLTVHMISPELGGVYKTQWQLCTSNGSVFGDILWAIVQVEATAVAADGTMAALPNAAEFQQQMLPQQQQQQIIDPGWQVPYIADMGDLEVARLSGVEGPQQGPQPQSSEDSEMC